MSELSDGVDKLADNVGELRTSVNQLARRIERTERAGTWAAVAIAVLLILLGVVGYSVWQNYQTAQRLESVTQRALCPVFGLVIGGYNPGTRAPGPARDEYIRTFDIMRQSLTELQCTNALVPPRVDG